MTKTYKALFELMHAPFVAPTVTRPYLQTHNVLPSQAVLKRYATEICCVSGQKFELSVWKKRKQKHNFFRTNIVLLLDSSRKMKNVNSRLAVICRRTRGCIFFQQTSQVPQILFGGNGKRLTECCKYAMRSRSLKKRTVSLSTESLVTRTRVTTRVISSKRVTIP